MKSQTNRTVTQSALVLTSMALIFSGCSGTQATDFDEEIPATPTAVESVSPTSTAQPTEASETPSQSASETTSKASESAASTAKHDLHPEDRIVKGTSIAFGGGHDHGDGFNPLNGFGAAGSSKIFNGLVTFNEKLEILPDLAVEVPKDKGTSTGDYVFNLKEGITFHDGSDFDAEDVVATYEAVMADDTASPLASNFDMITSVKATGPYQVEFKLDRKLNVFPRLLTLPIVPSELIDMDKTVQEMPIATKLIGTGPYKVESYTPGKDIVLTANADYFGPSPYIEKVTIVEGANEDSLAQRLKAGEIQMAELPPKIAKAIVDKEPDRFRLVSNHTFDYRGVVLPFDNPVTSDLSIRTAMNVAVNREGLVKGLGGGFGVPAYLPIPNEGSEWGSFDHEFPYDVPEAKRIVKDGGWQLGSDGILVKGKQKAEFTVMVPAGDTIRRNLARGFAQDMKRIGISVKLEELGWDAIEPRLSKDATLFAGGNPFTPMFQLYHDVHTDHLQDGFNNPGGYNNKKVDKLINEALVEEDNAKVKSLVSDVAKELISDPNGVYLTFLDHTYVVDKKYTGDIPVAEPHNHGFTWGPLWNLPDWQIKK